MKIYINARFLTQDITGVQRFAIEISLQLKKILKNDVVFLSPNNIKQDSIKEELEAIVIGNNTGHKWEQFDLPRYLKSIKSPLLLNIANTAPLFYSNKISTIHDIAFEIYPEMFSLPFRVFYKFLIPRLYKHSKSVFTVSEFSKKEILRLYGDKGQNIHVIYNGISNVFKPNDTKKTEKFILAVSSLNKRKNFNNLLKTFNEITELPDIKLYLIGGINRNFTDQGLTDLINSNNNIKFIGRVSDDELVNLYSSAEVFVFPSIYEGFGIPPLEAQSCGCPVVASNVTSIPEVCGESVLYFNPYDIADMKETLLKVLSEQGLKDKLVNKGFENINRFSWEKSANKILNIIEELN